MRTPLLIIPPWINKYYILDLREKNSFIRWAVARAHRVRRLVGESGRSASRDKSFEDYMLEGPLAALDAVEKATGEREVNMIGYCLGGTLLACHARLAGGEGRRARRRARRSSRR